MKLLRVGDPGEERPAVRTDDGRLLDLSSVASDIDGAFLDSGGVGRARAAVEAGGLPGLDTDGLRIGAPVARPGKIICVGRTTATTPPRPAWRSRPAPWSS